MSKNIKMLIAGIVSVVVLSGGIIALKLTEPETDTESESYSSESESLLLYDKNTDTVKSVSVENESCSYEITRTKEADEENSAEYTIKSLGSIPLNETIINSIPSSVASLTAERVIEENSSDLSQYGLENADTKIKIIFDDGTEKSVLIGDDTPSGDIYICFEGDNDVYSVSSNKLSVFRNDTDYYISLVCLEEPETNDDYPIVNYLQIERPDLEYPIRFEYDEKSANTDYSGGTSSTHIMTSPVFAYVDIGEGSTTITHGMFGLTAESAVSVNPTEDELEFAGLNEPVCTVTMDTDDGYNRVLKIGNTITVGDNEYYMGYFSDIDIIYAFSKDSLPWLDMQPLDIASSLVFGTYFYDIAEMTVTADGHDTLEFTTEGTDSDDFTVKLGGEDYDTDRFKEFYQFLIKTQAEEIYMEDPDESDLICSVEIKRNDEFDDETVEFYRGDNKNVIIKHNGVTSFINKINYDYVNVLLDNIDRVSTDEEFVQIWK